MTATESATDLEGALQEPRYELMPFESFYDQLAYLPEEATITVTASPQKPIETTVEYSLDAIDAGFEVVPHLAARGVADEAHLAELTGTLRGAGVTDIFVPGGDMEEPMGPYEAAVDLLEALDRIDVHFEEVGITGYPEGHPEIPDEILAAAMREKQPHASYIVTQICYDPHTVLQWIERIRENGITLPVYVGIPGVMRYQKLIGISRRVGVGQSIRFIQKTSGMLEFIREFLGSRGTYAPDGLVDGLAPAIGDPQLGLAGFHVYTFNRTQDTEAWRRRRLGL